jgi:hypothetical protein
MPDAREVYRKSDYGKAVRAAWLASPEGQASRKITNARRAAKDKGKRKKNPQQRHEHWRWQLQRRYNLTEAEYQAMLEKQGGVCAVCEKPPGKKRLHVDHDHITGKVRGLLCGACNLTLGFWNDDPKRFVRAADYLLKTQGEQSPN